jgi:hypothetical protein
MSDRYKGGILSPTAPTVIPQSAGGVYTLSQQLQYQGQGVWPPAVNYPITKSLRFRSSATAYLNRTPASAGNRRTFTWSGWVKLGTLGTDRGIFGASQGSGYGTTQKVSSLAFTSTDTLRWVEYYSADGISTDWSYSVVTTPVYRDPSAWYHIVVAVDTTQATAANRIKLYVNGLQVTALGTANYPTQNFDSWVNTTSTVHQHGLYSTGTPYYFDGYLAEVNFIDGQQLTPSSFGTTDAYGIWQPIRYSGTYGTNGFYLPFTNTTSTTTLVADSSGNGNNWTPNNISLTSGSTYDSMTDVPTNTNSNTANYATLNPLCAGLSGFAFWGNLYMSAPVASTWYSLSSTMALSGKIYFEVSIFSGSGFNVVGVTQSANGLSTYVGNTATSYGYDSAGNKNNNGSGVAYGASWVAGDIIGVAFDADALTLTFYKNNVSQGLAYTVSAGQYFAGLSTYNQNITINFGQQPFSYTPPSGFYPLNTYNLPTPTILDGDQYFNINLWTGNGTSQSITNSGSMQPDFVWYKGRSTTFNHGLFDSIRGTLQRLSSNLTSAESTTAGSLTAFNSNGFSVGSDAGANQNTDTYVGWQWRASNAAGVSNTQGTITSTVSANTTAGFSIATFTIQSSGNATVGHGLGIAPSMIIVKSRNAVFQWNVYHASLGNNAYLVLNATDAQVTGATTLWNSTSPTSTVFSLGTAWPFYLASATAVAYCFAPIAGYSAMGSYTGNGSTDGTFVYTGFRPAFVLTKRTDSSGNWYLWDNKRIISANGDAGLLYPDSSIAESDYNASGIDLLSNGFKLRNTDSSENASGGTYIYMAFAENPFKIANAR